MGHVLTCTLLMAMVRWAVVVSRRMDGDGARELPSTRPRNPMPPKAHKNTHPTPPGLLGSTDSVSTGATVVAGIKMSRRYPTTHNTCLSCVLLHKFVPFVLTVPTDGQRSTCDNHHGMYTVQVPKAASPSPMAYGPPSPLAYGPISPRPSSPYTASPRRASPLPATYSPLNWSPTVWAPPSPPVTQPSNATQDVVCRAAAVHIQAGIQHAADTLNAAIEV